MKSMASNPHRMASRRLDALQRKKASGEELTPSEQVAWRRLTKQQRDAGQQTEESTEAESRELSGSAAKWLADRRASKQAEYEQQGAEQRQADLRRALGLTDDKE